MEQFKVSNDRLKMLLASYRFLYWRYCMVKMKLKLFVRNAGDDLQMDWMDDGVVEHAAFINCGR